MPGEPEDWKEIEFAQALSRFAANLLRITAGAGSIPDFEKQLTRLVEKTKALADQKGWRKVDDVIAKELQLEPQSESLRAKSEIVRDALRLAAARIGSPNNLVSRSSDDLENSIRRYEDRESRRRAS